MRWIQPFRPLVSHVMAAFGALIVLGTFSSGAHHWLPSLVIGTAWMTVGWLGYPLIPSTPPSAPDLVAGARVIRRRRLRAILMPFSAVLCVPFMLMANEQDRLTIFFAFCLPACVALVYFAFSECPSCNRHFFIAGARSEWVDECVHCNFPLNAPPQPNKSLERTREG